MPTFVPPSVTACLLTGPTRSAVATIAVDGPGADELLNQAFDPATAGAIDAGQVRYGLWRGGHEGSAAAESVVLSRNPDRYHSSGSQSWEIHCHGGAVAAGRIIDDLRRLGAKVVPADRWMALQQQPLLIREATGVLSRTTSPRTAAIALDQVRGAMTQFVEDSLRLLAEEHAGGVAQVTAAAVQRLRHAAVGLHLDHPWRVVLAGPPNVGKSSLINAILGYRRSITLDQPGTTRDVLEAQTVIEGWPIRLSDTAGIHDAAQCEIETAGIEWARRELQRADLVLWLQDASEKRIVPPPAILEDQVATGVLEVINKIDLVATAPREHVGWIATSATTDQGIDALRLRIAELLVPHPPPPGDAVPVHTRQVESLERLAAAEDLDSTKAALRALAGYGC